MIKIPMNCVDLYNGCGGLSRGFANAGYNLVAAFENWDPAIQCYKKNFKHATYKLDLNNWQSAVNIIKKKECDIIIGGPPCQDFSNAGKRVEGEKAKLTVSFAKIVCAIKPRFFVMENVARVNKSEAYTTARELFKNAGYGLTEKVLNASYYGVPQNRKRFFCVGELNAQDGFLNDILTVNQSEFPLTVHNYLGDKMELTHYYRHPRSYSRRGVFSINEPAPTIRVSNRPLPSDYKRHEKDLVDPKENGIRALTFKERAFIQTFPEDFLWLESSSVNDELIGNAVPIKLAEHVANCISIYSENPSQEVEIGFKEWLQKEKNYKPRAAGNVLSRIRRMKRQIIQKHDVKVNETDLVSNFKELGYFDVLTLSVRSQLKRAQTLYSEYYTTYLHGA